jgi:hypothetical protein
MVVWRTRDGQRAAWRQAERQQAEWRRGEWWRVWR